MPVLWRYDAMRPLVLQALDLVSPEKAGRRVIALENPGRKGLSACVGWLYTGLQVMRPGEFANAHNHASAALRFIMEGSGAYTVVDGHKMDRSPPATSSSRRTAPGTITASTRAAQTTVWQDGLDMLLVNQLDANFYAVHPEHVQKSNYPVNDTSMVYGGPGLLPMGGEAWSKPYSPLLKYEWGPTYDALVRASKASDGSPYDGIIMQYVNPATGGPVMKTLGACIQLLRGGRAHQGAPPHRLDRLQRRQGRGPLDHQRQALRLEEERHLRGAVLGLARACQRLRARRRGAVLVQRRAVDAGARPLSRGSARATTVDTSVVAH